MLIQGVSYELSLAVADQAEDEAILGNCYVRWTALRMAKEE
jgi:hypothetical protein